jgi:hypothetical protein
MLKLPTLKASSRDQYKDQWRPWIESSLIVGGAAFSFHFRFARLQTKSGSYRKQSIKRSKQEETRVGAQCRQPGSNGSLLSRDAYKATAIGGTVPPRRFTLNWFHTAGTKRAVARHAGRFFTPRHERG